MKETKNERNKKRERKQQIHIKRQQERKNEINESTTKERKKK